MLILRELTILCNLNITMKEADSFMNSGIEFAQKINLAYNSVCKPLLHKFNLPQTAFDILMFLANNPEYTTARDIVEVRKIKANLVSVNVDRLVCDGYIIRKETKGDRRKTQLICTTVAEEIIKEGQVLQKDFLEHLFDNMDTATKEAFFSGMKQIEANLDKILEDN
jgi:DNA-binding MarR family transcriptional regulator